MYLKGNYVKIEIGIGKGKKLYDKRETIKQKTIKRNLEREDYYNN
ncbi:MAG: SsrA-binding protein [Clostridia bacterium]|nr:SsrA-binding protein [Clostridia bacterium]